MSTKGLTIGFFIADAALIAHSSTYKWTGQRR